MVVTDKFPVELQYVPSLDQVWVLNWRSERDIGIKTVQVIRDAAQKRKHHTVHPEPIDGQFDLVRGLYIPERQVCNFVRSFLKELILRSVTNFIFSVQTSKTSNNFKVLKIPVSKHLLNFSFQVLEFRHFSRPQYFFLLNSKTISYRNLNCIASNTEIKTFGN